MKKRIIVLLACLSIVTAMSVGCRRTSVDPVVSDISTIAFDFTEYSEITVQYTEPIEIPSIEVFNSDDSLIGAWSYTEDYLYYSYVFNADNTGTFVISDGVEEVSTPFTYTVDANVLDILFDQTLSVDSYTYSISDGELTLDSGSTDEPMILTAVSSSVEITETSIIE